jgi:enoyl-CoA hydratase/carnithine racemase
VNGRPRILLVSHYYPPHLGGIEAVVSREAALLTRRGAEVTVLTSAPGGAAGEPGTAWPGTGADAEAAGAAPRVVRVPAWNGVERRTGVPFPVLAPSVLTAAVRWARASSWVHIHDCLYVTSWAAGLAAALTRTPQLTTQHVGLVDHPSAAVVAVQRAVYGTAGRALLRRARTVFTLNAEVARFAGMLRLGAPGALGATKQLLRGPTALTMADDLAAMGELSARWFASAEGQEGVRAFAEKRRPSWVG